MKKKYSNKIFVLIIVFIGLGIFNGCKKEPSPTTSITVTIKDSNLIFKPNITMYQFTEAAYTAFGYDITKANTQQVSDASGKVKFIIPDSDFTSGNSLKYYYYAKDPVTGLVGQNPMWMIFSKYTATENEYILNK